MVNLQRTELDGRLVNQKELSTNPSLPKVVDVYHLTPLQEGLLYHSVNENSESEYLVQVSCKLEKVCPKRWRHAWESAVQRYPVLRTGVAWKNVSKPLQVVKDKVELNWAQDSVDVSGESDKDAAILEALKQEREAPLDLSQAPLHKCLLLTFNDGTSAFIWSYHHLILDAWSAAIVMDHVSATYNGKSDNSVIPFRPYVDWLGEFNVAQTNAFWKEKLKQGALPSSPPLKLPSSLSISRRPLNISADLTEQKTTQLYNNAKKNRVTLATMVMGAWALTLQNFCDLDTVTFGWVMADRPSALPLADTMAGLMVNVVPMRYQLDNSIDIAAFLKALQTESNETWEHARLPLTKLHDIAELPPGESLFESVVVFENIPELKVINSNELKVSERQAKWGTTYPLSLMIAPSNSLRVELAFNAEQVDAFTADAMLERFIAYLTFFSNSLTQTVFQAEKSISKRPPTTIRASCDDSSHLPLGEALIAKVHAKKQHAVVVLPDKGVIRGGELSAYVEVLVEQLMRIGLKPSDVIATHLDRDVSQLVALLAALKVGCAFLPIDPCLPDARKAHFIEDSGAKFVIARPSDKDLMAKMASCALNPFGDLDIPFLGELREGAKVPKNTAYIMYTSGSTGKPKGVLVPITALQNLLIEMCIEPGIRTDDVFLALTTLSFDISLLELLGPIWADAMLIIAPTNASKDPEYLATIIDSYKPTIMQATPVTWHMLLETGWQGNKVLTAWCGGEALSQQLASRLLPNVYSLWNMYGPTEATIWCCVSKITDSTLPITIGKAINGMSAVVRDKQGNLTPVGGRGELCIEGVGLALGYLNNPEATQKVFIESKDVDETISVYYRTGDLVQRLSNQQFRYLGRADDQVKINGVRIELCEVELALMRHSKVRSAVTKLWPAQKGRPAELIGYVTVNDANLNPEEVRDSARQFLPAGTLPVKVIILDDLPITPSGKKDREVLPHVESHTDFANRAFGSQLTQSIAGIWSDILQCEIPMSAANFFELGGNSIYVMMVMSRVNRLFDISLPIATLFSRPELSEFSAEVYHAISAVEGKHIALPKRSESGTWHPLSPVQQQLWFVRELDDSQKAFQLAVGLTLKGALNSETLSDAVNILQLKHGALRTVFREQHGHIEQQVADQPLTELEYVEASIKDVSSVVRQPIDIKNDGPLRVLLVKENHVCHHIVLIVHHIVVDEWSLSLLANDLSRIYQSLAKGDSIRSPYPMSYIDFLPVIAPTHKGDYQDLKQWKKDLIGLHPTTLPFERNGSIHASMFEGEEYRLTLSSRLVEQMNRVVAGLGVTSFSFMLSSFYALLMRFTASSDICVGVMEAGRILPEMEDVVGPFARPLPLRLKLDEEETIGALTRRLQMKLIQVASRGQVSSDKLFRELQIPLTLGENPFFNILFVMQNMPENPSDFGGLDVEILTIDTGISETNLLIEAFKTNEGMCLRFVYRAAAVDKTVIQDFALRWQHVLEQVVDDSTLPLVSINVLKKEEISQAIGIFTSEGEDEI